jgi:hypothetical protein
MRYSSFALGAIALAFLAACSHASNDTASAGGTAAATDAASPAATDAASAGADASASGQGTTITTDKGAVTIGGNVDPSKLGVPIYPGAAENPDAMSVTSANGAGSVAQFKTTDAFDKVYDYYKSQLPNDSETMKMASTMAMFKVQSTAGGQTLVQLTAGSGFTAITISHTTKP